MIRLAIIIAATLTIGTGIAVAAGGGIVERKSILDSYAGQTLKESPAFAGFSPERGRALYVGPHSGGSPNTNACAVCHTPGPKAVTTRPGGPSSRGRFHPTPAASPIPRRWKSGSTAIAPTSLAAPARPRRRATS